MDQGEPGVDYNEPNLNPLVCDICKQKFDSLDKLGEHQNVAHDMWVIVCCWGYIDYPFLIYLLQFESRWNCNYFAIDLDWLCITGTCGDKIG